MKKADNPRINFHILTPTKNIIKIPKNNTDREVPRSGWTTINKKGINIIRKGKKRLWIFFILS